MAKRKKGAHKTRIIREKISFSEKDEGIGKILIENFVSLQRVMVNLSVKFDNLAEQVSKLLNLFEISAKTLAEKEFDMETAKRDNAKIIEKLESITEQNRTIARGLTLMHERVGGSHEHPPEYSAPKTSLHRITPQPHLKTIIHQKEEGEYHKSISSNEQKTP